jgi:co-chaperonin GroES (HSP10)
MTSSYEHQKISNLTALRDNVIVEEMEFTGRQLSSGIILMNDNGTTAGIRPRWGKVYAIGPDQHEVGTGQWICVAHGRWTRGLDVEDPSGKKTLRRVDPKDILLISDEQPSDDTMSDAVQASQMTR